MADESKTKLRLKIAHVLFMDIVGYSKLLTDEQSEALQELNQIVRSTEAAREAGAAGALTVLPTGDGMALVFTGSVEEPVECALEISQALRAQPSLPVRMGIHSGPIHHVKDANGRENIAGVGINIAQRVMDCGDAGHILVSKRVADDLAQQRRWQPYIHELGDVEVKHGVVVSLVNLYAETIGNPTPPTRLGKARGSIPGSRVGTRKGLSPFARAIFIIVGLVIALIFVLAIVSVIFAPAIMRTLDQGRLATLPQPTATALPSLADTIKSAVAKQITDELQGELSRKKNAAVQPPPTGSAIPEKSIAVLPFDNLSRDPDNAYFCEGVQDEILTRLAKVSDLKVVSRTSTQHFKSSPDNLPQIAKQLGVMHVLEGSVQKFNDQVRVNVQLINALTDAHLWADTYDRKLTDIFAVESEIAKTVAETLQARLTGSEKSSIAKTPTVNPEAYELYLRGKFFAEKRTGADLRKSIEYYDQAIAKDPNYPLAYVGLADSHLLLSAYGAISPKESIPPAKAALKKALELDDSSAEAHASAGLLAGLELDVNRGITELERAIQLNPNYATAHHWLALPLMAIGQSDRAIIEGKRAIELDPLSLICNSDLGWIYFNARRYDEAEAQARKTLEMDSRFVVAHYYLGEVLQFKGKLPDAIAEYQKAFDLNHDPFSLAMLGQAYARQGKTDEARKVLTRLSEEAKSRYVSPYALAVVLTALGDKAHAIDELERGYDDAGFYISLIKVDPLFDDLRGDSRFEALVQKSRCAETTTVKSDDLFAELKRRNVYKVAIAYAVAGWALAQGIAQVFPVFDIPNWVVRLIVLLIIIGLPIALGLAWAFEVTPQGIKRTDAADAAGQHSRGHTWIYIVIVAAAFSIGLFFLGRYTAGNKTAVAAPNDLLNKSIAVLPFVDLSQTHDQEYFCDGISEEILDALAKIEGLRVIARTSSFSFKGKNSDVSEIAQKLNVQNILEGSLRREGDRIRISAQLVSAASGSHLWSETYERELQGVFALQDEITRSIVDALKIKLALAPPARAQQNTEAYDLYLQGLYFSNKSDEESLRKSLSLFQQALDKDPNFARAWTGIAKAWLWLADAYVRPLDAYPKAREAAKKALALDERDAEAHSYLGETKRILDRDLPGEEQDLKRALEIDRNSAPAHLFMALLKSSQGELDVGVKEIQEAEKLDPLAPVMGSFAVGIYLAANRIEDAINAGRRMLQIDPNYVYVNPALATAYREKGDFEKAVALYEKAQETTHFPSVGLAITYAKMGRRDDARRLLDQLIQKSREQYVAADSIAAVYAALDEKDEAFRWMARAVDEHSAAAASLVFYPEFRGLRSDPRFTDLVRRLGIDPSKVLNQQEDP